MIELTGNTLTIDEIDRVVFGGENVTASEGSLKNVTESRKAVERIVSDEKVVYGITTGFGKFSNVFIRSEDTDELQLNLIRSHACGVGPDFPESVSRAMLLLRANTLLKGYSGVSIEIVDMLIAMLNAGVHPIIPQQGSLGASGDLVPLAHLALTLVGEGNAAYKCRVMPSSEALRAAGLMPVRLHAKDGLALINGTQAMTAVGAISYIESEKLVRQSELVSSLTLQALRGITQAFDREVQAVRGYQEQLSVAERMLNLLQDSELVTTQGEERVQDAYSLRCIPQVLGAVWQVLGYVRDKLSIEINAATDNPLIFDHGTKVISGGNFHGEPMAFALDFLKLGMSELANISERRIERLVNTQLGGLPAFLSPEPGLQSGAMIMQYTAASLVSENKTLAHPASVDSIPSSANQEDHVSMGTTAARHAHMIIQNSRRVVAIELICALQGVDYRGAEKLSPITKTFYDRMREITPRITKDRIFSTDIKNVEEFLKDGDFSKWLI